MGHKIQTIPERIRCRNPFLRDMRLLHSGGQRTRDRSLRGKARQSGHGGLRHSRRLVTSVLPMQPQPIGLSRKEIEEVAEHFAHQVGYQPGRPLDKIVQKLGGEIHVQDTSNDGQLVVNPDGSFKIFLSPFTGRSRDRFTLAHELGHFVLHSESGKKPITVPRGASNKLETEANLFAAALLMPAEKFRSVATQFQQDGAIAAHFDVSPDAVRVRKQALGVARPQ